MQEIKQPSKKPLIFYYIVTLLIVMVLNMTLFPTVLQQRVQDVTYDQFMSMTYDKNVGQVEIEGDEITFTDKDNQNIYRTTKTDDPDLTQRLYDSGAVFQEIDTQPGMLTSLLVGWVLPLLPFLLIGYFLNRRMKKAMGGADGMMFGMGGGGSGAKMYVPSSTGIRFADVAGEDEAKELLGEIVDFLHDPDKYRAIGATLPKGALLVGPPGTGKTLLAKAVAGEANVPFFSMEMFVGRGAAKVRDLFKQANEKAPCIIFIDEIDTIGKKRDGQFSGGNDEREQTLNQLLTEMDGFDGSKGVVVLAATNRPDSLDPALLRPGRFDRRIPVELPDLQGRIDILKVHAKKIRLAEDVDFEPIAKTAAGASGAELANIVNEAALRAVRAGAGERGGGHRRVSEEEPGAVRPGEADRGLPRGGPRPGGRPPEPLRPGAEDHHHPPHLGRPGLHPPGGRRGPLPDEQGGAFKQDRHLHRRTGRRGAGVPLGDHRGLQRHRAGHQAGPGHDLPVLSQYGMSDEFGFVALQTVTNQYLGGDASLACSPETQALMDKKVTELVEEQHRKALTILKEHEGKLHQLAGYLYQHETITGKEFMDILERQELPEAEA